MTGCTVPGCPRAAEEDTHRRLCPRCTHQLRALLRELVGQMPLLQASLQLDRSPTTGSVHGGRAHSPMPVRGDVLTLLGPGSNSTLDDPYGDARGDQDGPLPIDTHLRGWAEMTALHVRLAPGPGIRPGRTWAAWLAAYAPWILTAPWAGLFHQELTELVGRVRAITRTEPRRRPLAAPCPSCGAFGLVEEDWQPYVECVACELLLTPAEYVAYARRVLPSLYRTALQIWTHERIAAMNERVPVRVLLLIGDEAEIVADVPPAERAEPERYPAAEIAEALGVALGELPGKRLTAEAGADDRLTGWQRA